ncbi:MAG TPA: OmpA family protein [Polyangia bacterium]|nr:OmpA family protein [Polyangia bacterium]
MIRHMTVPVFMRRLMLPVAGALALTAAPARPARALDFGKLAGKATGAAGNAARDKAVKEANARLLAEGRKDQCSFKTDSDQLMPGCDAKLKKLANTLIDVKKHLNISGVTSFKFEVSGHTDSSGKAEHNKELSAKRAATIAHELESRGVAASDIISVGMGSERPLVTPDDTPAKKAKNRRYEIQIRF